LQTSKKGTGITSFKAQTFAANEEYEQGVIHIFTDGACSGNPGPAGCGVVLVYNGQVRELSKFIGNATNNIAELTALKLGLKAIRDRTKPVHVYSDSEYALGVLTRDWKAKANRELVDEIKTIIETFPSIFFHKVQGHSNIRLNERADLLACAAIQKQHKRIS